MKKIYRKLTKDQKERGVIFSSCLSSETVEQENDNIEELKKLENGEVLEVLNKGGWIYTKQIIIQSELKGNGDQDLETVKKRLLDDSFFNDSHWNYNIIRT